MSITSDLLNGIAAATATAGLAVIRDGTDFLSSETALTFKNLPANPDRVVCLTPFGANSDQPEIPLGIQPVQARFRGTADPRDVDELADAFFALWHGAINRTFGSVHVVQILRTSSIPLGMDEQSRRWERSDNYDCYLDYPTTANRPT
jgi:minor capsid protein